MKFDLGSGHLGNGITVWNRAKEEHGDYQKIAHIDAHRKITWYIKNPPKEVVEYVQQCTKEDPSVSTSQPDQKVFHSKAGASMDLKNLKLGQTVTIAGTDGFLYPQSAKASDILKVLDSEYESVHWLMNKPLGKTEGAAIGVAKSGKDFAVALYEFKKEGKDNWIYVKTISGGMGPYERPPEKFWDLPEVKHHLDPQWIELNRHAKTSDEIHNIMHQAKDLT